MTTFEQIRERMGSVPDYSMFLSDQERADLEQELNEMLAAISKCETIEEADPKLEQLGKMQDILAILCFRYHINLSAKQRRFVREYDRWDLPADRDFAFRGIKKGNYP